VVIGLRQRQMQVAQVGRVHVVAHVREAGRRGDAPVRDGLDPAAVIPGVCPRRAMLTATVKMGVQPEALAL
jgi:hypothetical protein